MSMSHLYGRDEDVNVERFEVTDWDLENEFNPERVRHRQSKEEAVYGVWAEDNDDDDERPGFSGGRSKNRDFTAPVSFVSGGVKRPVAEEEEDDDDDDNEEGVSGKGSGEEDGARLGPWTEALQRAKGGRGARQSLKGGIRPSRTVAGLPPEKGFGSWERHTKGIGHKLLQKMGYVPGLGLGKNAQGIVLPVEAKVRKGRGAIGAHGPERTKQSLREFPAPKSDEEEDEEFKQQLSQWRKEPGTGAGASKKGPRYTYRTVEELKAKGLSRKVAPPSQLSQVKVIDLTGKSQKVYSSYDQMSQRHSVPTDEAEAAVGEAAAPTETKRKGFALPELEHNLQLLVELTEQDIVETDRRLRHEKNEVVALQHEARRLEALLEQEDRAVERLGRVLAVAESCERRARSLDGDVPPGEGEPPLVLAEAAQVFRSLQSDFYEEYRSFDLATLAVLTVQPLLKQSFAGWDPLKWLAVSCLSKPRNVGNIFEGPVVRPGRCSRVEGHPGGEPERAADCSPAAWPAQRRLRQHGPLPPPRLGRVDAVRALRRGAVAAARLRANGGHGGALDGAPAALDPHQRPGAADLPKTSARGGELEPADGHGAHPRVDPPVAAPDGRRSPRAALLAHPQQAGQRPAALAPQRPLRQAHPAALEGGLLSRQLGGLHAQAHPAQARNVSLGLHDQPAPATPGPVPLGDGLGRDAVSRQPRHPARQTFLCQVAPGAVRVAQQQPQLRGDHQVVPGLEVALLGAAAGSRHRQGEVQRGAGHHEPRRVHAARTRGLHAARRARAHRLPHADGAPARLPAGRWPSPPPGPDPPGPPGAPWPRRRRRRRPGRGRRAAGAAQLQGAGAGARRGEQHRVHAAAGPAPRGQAAVHVRAPGGVHRPRGGVRAGREDVGAHVAAEPRRQRQVTGPGGPRRTGAARSSRGGGGEGKGASVARVARVTRRREAR